MRYTDYKFRWDTALFLVLVGTHKLEMLVSVLYTE